MQGQEAGLGAAGWGEGELSQGSSRELGQSHRELSAWDDLPGWSGIEAMGTSSSRGYESFSGRG